MVIRLNKDKFAAIDGAFLMLKEDPFAVAPKDVIRNNLESVFDGYKFDIKIVDTNQPNNRISFVMSVFPEVDTASRIISAMLTGHEQKIISDLWKKNTKWTIEIDKALFSSNFTDRELTSLLLHEVGHIVATNSIPNRLYTIMSYEVAKTKASNKAIIKDEIFRNIMSLPILDACVSDKQRSSIREEIKADTFAKKMGYSNELYNALTKLTKDVRGTSRNDDISKLTNFSLSTLDELKERKENLAKRDLLHLSKECASPYIKEVLDTFIEKVLTTNENSNVDKVAYISNRIDNDINDYYTTEFFGITKTLKRIEPADIDYVMIKMESIKSESDKLMLITYIHSKIDLIDYYIQILENPKLARKYTIPNSLDQLKSFKSRLLVYRDNILKYKIPDKFKGILVAWPEGYEG
jgi:hypothetical protein